MATPLHFFLLAGAVGTVQGGAQALSRSLFAAMVPRHRSAEYFGFFATSGKLAGVTGPVVFGLVSQLTGTGRLGILSLVLFFVFFTLTIVRIFFMDKKLVDKMKSLPFSDEEGETKTNLKI